MSKPSLIKLLASPIAYYAILAKVGGGVTAGVFLSQLIYWTGRGKQADGWIWKSSTDMEQETGLTRREQETARRNLKERGFIDERLAGVPATVHYRVNLDAIMEAVAQFGVKRESSLAENAKLDSTKAPNLNARKRQTIHRLPETTPENTTEITTSNDVDADAVAAADELLPVSKDERLLFDLLTEAQTAQGRRAPKQRFQNPMQARAFRDAVKVLNGQTEGVLRRFFISGNGGLGNAVAYLAGAARKHAPVSSDGIEILEPTTMEA